MKYILAIALGTIVIGLLLSFGVYWLFDDRVGLFFVKFLAVPIGGVCSFILFIIYDEMNPKK